MAEEPHIVGRHLNGSVMDFGGYSKDTYWKTGEENSGELERQRGNPDAY